MLLFTICPIKPDTPITDADAKFVPIATLDSIFNIDIIAGIRMLPRTSPIRPPRKPTPNPIIGSRRTNLFLLRVRILSLSVVSSILLLLISSCFCFFILEPLSNANDSYKTIKPIIRSKTAIGT